MVDYADAPLPAIREIQLFTQVVLFLLFRQDIKHRHLPGESLKNPLEMQLGEALLTCPRLVSSNIGTMSPLEN